MSRDAVLPPPPPPAAAPLAGAGGRSSIVMVPGASANLASLFACKQGEREQQTPDEERGENDTNEEREKEGGARKGW